MSKPKREVHEWAKERFLKPSPDQKSHQLSPAQTANLQNHEANKWLLLKPLNCGMVCHTANENRYSEERSSGWHCPSSLSTSVYLSVRPRQSTSKNFLCPRLEPSFQYMLSKNRNRLWSPSLRRFTDFQRTSLKAADELLAGSPICYRLKKSPSQNSQMEKFSVDIFGKLNEATQYLNSTHSPLWTLPQSPMLLDYFHCSGQAERWELSSFPVQKKCFCRLLSTLTKPCQFLCKQKSVDTWKQGWMLLMFTVV